MASGNKVEIKGQSSESACTFVMQNEDHTMGNALRYVLLRDPSVTFAGYSVPHPHESRMNLRVQAKDKTAVQALRDGLDTLMRVCEHVEDVFEAQVPVLPAHAGGQMEEEGDDGE